MDIYFYLAAIFGVGAIIFIFAFTFTRLEIHSERKQLKYDLLSLKRGFILLSNHNDSDWVKKLMKRYYLCALMTCLSALLSYIFLNISDI